MWMYLSWMPVFSRVYACVVAPVSTATLYDGVVRDEDK